MNMSNSVAEYACVDIQCLGNSATNNMEAEINRSVYERLQMQSREQKNSKQMPQTSPNISNNNTAKGKTAQQRQSPHPPPPYNLGQYFPRVSSEPTARKTYQTSSSRERDLKVKRSRVELFNSLVFNVYHQTWYLLFIPAALL